jgi:hypothetical protein
VKLVRPCIRPTGAAFHMPLAIMPFARLRSPIVNSHSKCTAPVGSPDPAVSTGFMHQLLSALSNLVGDRAPCFVLCDDRLSVALAAVINAQTMRVVLLASAIAATLVVRRVISCTSHGRLVPFRSGSLCDTRGGAGACVMVSEVTCIGGNQLLSRSAAEGRPASDLGASGQPSAGGLF